MNSDEVKALATKLALTIFSIWGGAAGITGSDQQTIAAGVGVVAAIAYGVYTNWNQRRVPEKSIVTASAPTVAEAKVISAPAEAVAATK